MSPKKKATGATAAPVATATVAEMEVEGELSATVVEAEGMAVVEAAPAAAVTTEVEVAPTAATAVVEAAPTAIVEVAPTGIVEAASTAIVEVEPMVIVEAVPAAASTTLVETSMSTALIVRPDRTSTLEMIRSGNSASGFKGVKKHHKGGFQARVKRDGKKVHLGTFATAEDAALAYAASAEGQKAMAKAACTVPAIPAEEVSRLALSEGLTLLKAANNKTGFKGVYKIWSKYQARVVREGKVVILGSFHSGEEAALCYARAPEGQAAAIKVSRA